MQDGLLSPKINIGNISFINAMKSLQDLTLPTDSFNFMWTANIFFQSSDSRPILVHWKYIFVCITTMLKM